MNNAEELVPCEVIVTDRISVAALVALSRTDDDLADLTDGKHRRTSLGVKSEGELIHSFKLLYEDNPNRLSAGLSAENIGELKH